MAKSKSIYVFKYFINDQETQIIKPQIIICGGTEGDARKHITSKAESREGFKHEWKRVFFMSLDCHDGVNVNEKLAKAGVTLW